MTIVHEETGAQNDDVMTPWRMGIGIGTRTSGGNCEILIF